MADNVSCVAEANIHDGRLENLKVLMKEMVDAIKRNEPGTLNFEYFIADDGKSFHAYERYTDSEAYMVHLRNFGQNFAERVMPNLTITKITLYGNPSDEVRAVFAHYAPICMRLFAGVAR
jgi:quinol monooxygenase YgiN